MTLPELLKLLRKKWYLLVVLPLAFGGATAAFSWGVLDDVYTASVSLYVLATDEKSENQSITSNDMVTSQYLANDIAVLVKSNRVMGNAAQALGLDTLDDYDIQIESGTTNRVITLSVTGEDAWSVAKVADELAEQAGEAAVDIMGLQAVNVIDAAQAPDSPSGPNRLKHTIIAIMAGFLVAIFWVVLVGAFDTSIKSEEEFKEMFDLPIVGSMPAIKKVG